MTSTMAYKKLSLLAAVPLITLAQAAGGMNNFSAAFFPTSDQTACEDHNIDTPIIITTESIPRAYTCFNLAELFSGDSDSGFQNDTSLEIDSPQNAGNEDENAPPKGIDWVIENHDAFKSNANYTNVWFHQVNNTGDSEAGEAGRWVFYTYAFEDCEQVGGDDFEPADYPWSESSCQTESMGECQTLPQTIKSFAIASSAEYNEAHGECQAWAELGAAPQLVPRGSMVAVLAAGVAAYFLVM